MSLSSYETSKLNQIASNLRANPQDLYAMINFESGWNPKAKNPYSSARGLIQFIDSTARGLGFRDSLDLVNQNPTRVQQLDIVERYLRPYAPFPTPQSLFMAVFYPRARTWSLDTEFPFHVQKVNPNIRTVRDYVNKVYGKSNIIRTAIKTRPLWVDALAVALIVGGGALYLNSKQKKVGNRWANA